MVQQPPAEDIIKSTNKTLDTLCVICYPNAGKKRLSLFYYYFSFCIKVDSLLIFFFFLSLYSLLYDKYE